MSVQALTWVLEHSKARGNARCVLTSIANHADRTGENAWPAVATIARESCCSDSTVRRSIAELVRIGELEVLPRAGLSGSRFRPTNAYRMPGMLPPKVGASSDESYRPNTTELPVKTDESYRSPLNNEPSLEPPVNRPKDLKALPQEPLGFAEFWKAYPKQRGKGAAREAWLKRIRAGADAEHLVAMAERYARYVVAALEIGEIESMHFVPWPQKWLREEREDDHLTTPGRAPAAISKIERARAERRMREQARGGGDNRNREGGVVLGHATRDVRRLDAGDC